MKFEKSPLWLILLWCLFANFQAISQQAEPKYMVCFGDKEGVSFDPYGYFDEKTIERRVKFGIPLIQYSDKPVRQDYINQVELLVNDMDIVSRWFNSVSVNAEKSQIEKVRSLPFVREVYPLESTAQLLGKSFSNDLHPEDYEILKEQTEILGVKAFHDSGYTGKGVRVAIFDAGFPSVDTSPVFSHIRSKNRIVKTWDFARNRENVFRANSHGTMVMSCIAGKLSDTLIGLATDAEFLLARTENAIFEPYSEEENWLAAAEWADKNGADIINSSLGYTFHRYFNGQMDGKTSLVSRAANMAASKGILVVNAAGNEGGDDWHIIGSPADADSVLAVGGIDPETKIHTYFSSYGPTSDKRMKPNVCAYGHVIASGSKSLTQTQGTSFSSPLVAGFAACALQSNPSLTNMELFHEIEKSASLYPHFDYAHGFGIPQAEHFTNSNYKILSSFEFVDEGDKVKVIIKEGQGEPSLDKLFYAELSSTEKIKKYYVLEVSQREVLEFSKSDFRPGEKVRVSFNRYSEVYEF